MWLGMINYVNIIKYMYIQGGSKVRPQNSTGDNKNITPSLTCEQIVQVYWYDLFRTGSGVPLVGNHTSNPNKSHLNFGLKRRISDDFFTFTSQMRSKIILSQNFAQT